MANYGRELRMGGDIRKRGKVESVTEFVEKMKRVHEEAGAALKKAQEDMKRQADRGRKETENWKKGDRVMLSTKDLAFKERPARKLVDRYIGPYTIEEVVSINVIKLQLLTSIRIHPVVNVSWVVQYKEKVGRQKKKEGKPIEVEEVEEWKGEKILNKRKIRGVKKYLVWWKGFTAESDIWEREEDLEHAKKLVDKFKGRMSMEVRRQEEANRKQRAKVEEFKRMELPGKYTAKLLYGWDDGKFKKEYLKKLERNWQKWKSVSLKEKP